MLKSYLLLSEWLRAVMVIDTTRRLVTFADPFPIAPNSRDNAQGVPTRLAALDDRTQRDLVNWGYVIADTALRRWVWSDAPRPTTLPL